MNKIVKFFEFFYALPTQYIRDLPDDREMILPCTLTGAVLGGSWQWIAFSLLYSQFGGDSLEHKEVIGSLSAIPVLSNVVSGLYEWMKINKRNNHRENNEGLEKFLRN